MSLFLYIAVYRLQKNHNHKRFVLATCMMERLSQIWKTNCLISRNFTELKVQSGMAA